MRKLLTLAIFICAAHICGAQSFANRLVTNGVLMGSDRTAINASLDSLRQRVRGYDGGTITVGQIATGVAINLGPRYVTVSGVTGLLSTDRVLLLPITPGLPSGYGLMDYYVSAAGTVKINVYGPLLAIGASYSFTLGVIILR